MKKVLAIHDISCVGGASLTAALPIISGFGATCNVLPTALLSNQTGFQNFTYLDLTDEMRKIMAAWQNIDLEFDAIYSGFLAGPNQVDVVKDVIDRYKTTQNITVIDPVMADKGKLYSVYNQDYVGEMKKLIRHADIITPNMTEAHLLAGIEFKDGPYERKHIGRLLSKLRDQAENVIITGVSFDDKQIGAASIDKAGAQSYHLREKYSGDRQGTGDVFTSALVGSLLHDPDLQKAMKIAVEFVTDAIKATPTGTDPNFGINFEKALYDNKQRTIADRII